jgi:hypothetical protein
MQWELHSSRVPSTRLEVAATTVEKLNGRQLLSSAAPEVRARMFAFLVYCRKQKWIWALLVFWLAFESYFVRGLLTAFFFFTVLYLFLVALVALYLLIDHVLHCGAVWAVSLVRSFYFLLHHHLAWPTEVPNLSKSRAIDGGQELGHA